MYAFISGKIHNKGTHSVCIENNGIGYNILVSNDCLSKLPNAGGVATLYTYMQITEDAHSLFGFIDMSEKEMFLKLISISGVGCKMALQILSGISPLNLVIAIANKDIKLLSSVKGIGKKTAERIILELKEKVDITDINTDGEVTINLKDEAVTDAIMALVSLGIGKTEAANAVMKAREITDRTDKLITIALRSFDR